jgi:hypothetical protein
MRSRGSWQAWIEKPGPVLPAASNRGESGLDLEAQQDAIRRFRDRRGFRSRRHLPRGRDGQGIGRDRTPAATARRSRTRASASATWWSQSLTGCYRATCISSRPRRPGVPLIVAELGRDAQSWILHIFAALAEKERIDINARTMAALKAAKARGVRLGNPRLEEARAAAKTSVKASATPLRQAPCPWPRLCGPTASRCAGSRRG